MEMKYVVPDMAQSFGTLEFAGESEPVSYTHLDVYKRQVYICRSAERKRRCSVKCHEGCKDQGLSLIHIQMCIRDRGKAGDFQSWGL